MAHIIRAWYCNYAHKQLRYGSLITSRRRERERSEKQYNQCEINKWNGNLQRKTEIKYENPKLWPTFAREPKIQMVFQSGYLLPIVMINSLGLFTTTFVYLLGVGATRPTDRPTQQKTDPPKGKGRIPADKEQHIFNQSLKLAHNPMDFVVDG